MWFLKSLYIKSVVCSTGDPQGTVLSPFLFNLYTSHFGRWWTALWTGVSKKRVQVVSHYKYLGVYVDNHVQKSSEQAALPGEAADAL